MLALCLAAIVVFVLGEEVWLWRHPIARVRGMRLCAALLAGASLSLGGLLAQGLFRNPLASPSILGTTAGASFGGQVMLLVSGSWGWLAVPDQLLLPWGCFFGSVATLGIILAVSRRTGDVVSLLLAGFALSSLFLSLGSLVTSLSQDRFELGRAVLAFVLGDLRGVDSIHLRLAIPLWGVSQVAAWGWSGTLDIMQCGDDEARALGVDVSRVRTWLILWVALLTTVAVSLGGNVVFVGLVVPHAARLLLGPTHGPLVPAVAILGGVFVAACDALVMWLPSVTGLDGGLGVPLGVVTGLVGAPVFLWMVLRGGAFRAGPLWGRP